MSDLVLLRPWWLLAVPVILLLGWIGARAAHRMGGWDRAVDPHLMAAMRAMGRVETGRGGVGWWPVLAALGVALALTGPAKQTREMSGYRNLDGVLLVVDISRSMVMDPAFAEGIVAARTVAAVAGSRQTGLIVFAGDAYLVLAMTTDGRALGGALALLDEETAPDEGSDVVRGLVLAREVLTQAEIAYADVVLLTDGDGIGGASMAEAARMAESGMALSVLHVTTERGGGDEPGRTLARAGGGTFATVSDPYPIADALAGRVASALAQTDYALVLWRDYGRYLLLLALLPMLMLFRRLA